MLISELTSTMFSTICLLEKVARRVQDAKVMKVLNLILKSTGKRGVPQGGVVSPVAQ